MLQFVGVVWSPLNSARVLGPATCKSKSEMCERNIQMSLPMHGWGVASLVDEFDGWADDAHGASGVYAHVALALGWLPPHPFCDLLEVTQLCHVCLLHYHIFFFNLPYCFSPSLKFPCVPSPGLKLPIRNVGQCGPNWAQRSGLRKAVEKALPQRRQAVGVYTYCCCLQHGQLALPTQVLARHHCLVG